MKQIKRRIALLLSCVMVVLSTVPAYAAWVQDENSNWHYYLGEEEEDPVVGAWLFDTKDVSWYYFDDDGIMVSGKTLQLDGTAYTFSDSGKLTSPKEPQSGEIVVTSHWRREENGDFVYFDDRGHQVFGDWVEDAGKWYYLQEDGKMASNGKLTIDGTEYTFAEDGALLAPAEPVLKGWQKTDEGWYYYDASGKMVTDEWIQSGDAWFYLGADGLMYADKLFTYQDDLYYVDESGARFSGWRLYEDKYYFFRADGRAVRGGWKDVADGHWHFEEDCTLSVNAWIPDEGGLRYVDGEGRILKDTIANKDGGQAYINAEGYFDETFSGTKNVGGITYTIKNGMVDESVEPSIATPANASSVESMLKTLDQLNQDGGDNAFRAEVADALSEGARQQKNLLDEETLREMERVLATAYGISIAQEITMLDDTAVTVVGLILASGFKNGDNMDDYRLVVDQATPATADKVVLDIKLLVNGEESDLEAPVWVDIDPPAVFVESYDTSKYTYKIVHTHNGTETTLPAINTHWIVDEQTGDLDWVSFKTDSFSEFTLVATPKSSGGGSGGGSYSGSGSGSTAATGKWVQAADGIRWWYQNADGTWPASEWAQLSWNGRTDWYYFDAEGYMVTGWLTDGGYRYYLHPVSDGTQGHMYTGWNLVDGKYYYFREASGGPQGSLLVSGTTPDGYQVDANGVWIQ